MRDTPVAMPSLGAGLTYTVPSTTVSSDYTLEDYFKRLQQVPDVKSKQVAGSHYHQGSVQPWEIISSWGLDFWSGNVVKYLLRFPHKNGKEDLEKAKHYLEYLIDNYEEVYDKFYKSK